MRRFDNLVIWRWRIGDRWIQAQDLFVVYKSVALKGLNTPIASWYSALTIASWYNALTIASWHNALTSIAANSIARPNRLIIPSLSLLGSPLGLAYSTHYGWQRRKNCTYIRARLFRLYHRASSGHTLWDTYVPEHCSWLCVDHAVQEYKYRLILKSL